MLRDPIVEEMRRIKESIAAEYGYDIRAMVKALRAEQEAGGRQVVSFAPKRVPMEQD